ncbi:gluconate 2-dehydrogenase subunit 3 family protein [Niabella insulamsoli]|uniref:gluconate 2-dehydrogenase subunit 3 family protein n=1 Tax=Niabella insulamsoli TaxID=3144874 RepID=UPI0031FCB1D0
MNRREALTSVSALLGVAIIGGEAFLTGCKNAASDKSLFTPKDIALLDEVAETIIPATAASGGGKAALSGAFMKTIVTDCYNKEEQKVFLDGIKQLNASCREKYKKDFVDLPSTEKAAFLTALYQEAKAYAATDAYQKEKEIFDQQQEAWVKSEAAKKNFGAAYLKKKYPPHYFTMMRQLAIWGYFSSKEGMTRALRYVETPGRYDGAYPYKKGDKAWAL